MLGSLLAGTKESLEKLLFLKEENSSYRGMGSVETMQEGSKDRYFQDVEDDVKKLVPEGGRVPISELNEKHAAPLEVFCWNGLLWVKRHSYFAEKDVSNHLK
jgi:IMP dehydrogenase/GMP reductase